MDWFFIPLKNPFIGSAIFEDFHILVIKGII